MAFNPEQFKPKKKRVVDPNAPPRPNLLSQDKKLREQQTAFEELQHRVRKQEETIMSLKTQLTYLENSLGQVVSYLRKGQK